MIIGFAGPKGSGKSSAADCLQRRYGYELHSFARPIKDMLETIGVQNLHKNKDIPIPFLFGQSSRQAMNSLGDWGRKIDEMFWIRRWQETFPSSPNIVVDDVRLPQEFAVIKALGGTIIGIKREGHNHSTEHETESHKFNCDVTIVNNGSLNDLDYFIEALVEYGMDEK